MIYCIHDSILLYARSRSSLLITIGRNLSIDHAMSTLRVIALSRQSLHRVYGLHANHRISTLPEVRWYGASSSLMFRETLGLYKKRSLGKIWINYKKTWRLGLRGLIQEKLIFGDEKEDNQQAFKVSRDKIIITTFLRNSHSIFMALEEIEVGLELKIQNLESWLLVESLDLI